MIGFEVAFEHRMWCWLDRKIMSQDKLNFNLEYGDSSSDDESIFITQTPREIPSKEEKMLDKSMSDLDTEGLLNMTNDSAIGSVTSVDGADGDNSDKEFFVNKEPLNIVQVDSPELYKPAVEDISEPER